MATTLTKKPLGFFKPAPGNPRQPLPVDELEELAASLIQKQHVPLLAKTDGTILDGYRRWSAAMLDGKPEQLDCIITDEPLTAGQVKEIQLVTALHRADLKPYEQYLACRDWLELNPGATAKDLAAKINRDPSMLVRILSLGGCIPAVQEAAAEGKLGPSVWYEIKKLPGEEEQQAMLAATLAGESRDQLERRGRKSQERGSVRCQSQPAYYSARSGPVGDHCRQQPDTRRCACDASGDDEIRAEGPGG